jgi:hypothetical protein
MSTALKLVLFVSVVFLAIGYNAKAVKPYANSANAGLEELLEYPSVELQKFLGHTAPTVDPPDDSEPADSEDADSEDASTSPNTEPAQRVHPASDVYRVATSNIFIVFIYSVILIALDSRSARDVREAWADSIYFLGFILTLSALVAALGSITRYSEEAKLVSIIVQNAVALSSTLVALIVRTAYVLGLFRSSDETLELEVLRRSIDELGRQLTLLRIKLRKGLDDVVKETEELANRIKGVDYGNAVTASLDKSFSPFTTTLSAKGSEISNELEKLRELLAELLDTEKEFSQKGRANIRSLVKSGEELSQLNASLTSILDELNSSYLHPDWHKRISDKHSDLSEKVASLAEELTVTTTALTQYNNVNSISSRLTRLWRKLRGHNNDRT